MGLFSWLFGTRDRSRRKLTKRIILSCPQAEIDQWSPTEGEDDAADRLVKTDCFAFVLACSVDRMGPSEKLWRIPYLLRQHWGHLNPSRIAQMNFQTIAAVPAVRRAPTQISRGDIAKTIVSAAALVSQKCNGAAERLFDGTIDEMLDKLQMIYGVGEGIARMAVSLRMLYFGLQPQPGGQLLPKFDVHVQRVLVRSGLVKTCSNSEVQKALEGYTARDIACLDFSAWTIGRTWCHARNPECHQCPLTDVCSKLNVTPHGRQNPAD